MTDTKLPREVCGHIWGLSNPKGLNTFKKPMFLIAMHLMYKKRQNQNLILPNQLPVELVQSAMAACNNNSGASPRNAQM